MPPLWAGPVNRHDAPRGSLGLKEQSIQRAGRRRPALFRWVAASTLQGILGLACRVRLPERRCRHPASSSVARSACWPNQLVRPMGQSAFCASEAEAASRSFSSPVARSASTSFGEARSTVCVERRLPESPLRVSHPRSRAARVFALSTCLAESVLFREELVWERSGKNSPPPKIPPPGRVESRSEKRGSSASQFATQSRGLATTHCSERAVAIPRGMAY